MAVVQARSGDLLQLHDETGEELDADSLIAWSKERLGGHKYPRRIEFVPALPLGPSGKILKRELVKDL